MFGQYKVSNADEMMMLGVGQPSPDILNAGSDFISYSIDNPDVLQYGMKQGFEGFRELVKKLIKTYSNCNIDTNNIYMTNGITQGIFMLASLLKNQYGYNTVYVEDLTYFIIINIFKDFGYKIKSFNTNNFEELRENLKKETEPCLIYLIPFCNNPTGKTLCNQSMVDEFIRITQEFNVLVLSDETYQFLHYYNWEKKLNRIKNAPLATQSNKIISLGTFSKILVPGIRLGWIYTQNNNVIIDNKSVNLIQWLDNTGFMDSGGSVNPTMAYMVCSNLMSKFDKYKEFLSSVIIDLENKSNLVLRVLNKYPEYFEVIEPDGGYFIFVKSLKVDANKLLELAKKIGLSFHCGCKFTIRDDETHTFRLSVSYYSLSDFERWFEEKITNLVSKINLEFRISYEKKTIGLLGQGKLGKLIELEAKDYNVRLIDRNFDPNELINLNIDTIIDVSSPEGTINLLDRLIKKDYYPKLIIGTTGHTQEQILLIKKYSELSPIVYCSNFSQGIQQILSIISNLKFEVVEAEITDIHHKEKKDSPSGTAKLIKEHLQLRFPYIQVKIISERIDDVVGTHFIKLNGINESIEINHHVSDRKIFASGCVSLIEKIKNANVGFHEWLN